MTTAGIVWIIIAVVFVFGIAPFFFMSYLIYERVLVRYKPGVWIRACSEPSDPETLRMWNEGVAWADTIRDRIREVEIRNDGFRLCGEFIDFGGKSTVIIIPGRQECLMYSYYYAMAYEHSGLNVLVIDNRAHGNSDGKRTALGFREYSDVLRWAALLHDDMGQKKVLLHGICVGAEHAMFAITNENCPDYVAAIIADGMFCNFYESFKLHMEHQKRPMFPFLYIVMFYVWILTGAHPMTDGPAKRISKLNKPILFLHGRLDLYSLPKRAEEMYNTCTSEKKIVWFDKGGHSRLRNFNTEKYDRTICEYVKRFQS